MKKPSKKQIEKEIKELTEIKPKVRRLSMFGENNQEAIGVQIEVLKNNLSFENIDERWGASDEDCASQSLYENASEARRWLDGESEEESLADGWLPLIEKERDEK